MDKYEEDSELLENFENYLEKDKSRAKRRRTDRSKAYSKAKLDKQISHFVCYKNLHQYSKNKIHCSCPACSAKSNMHKYKAIGNNTYRRRDCSITCRRYGKKNYKINDIRRIDALNYSEVS